MCDASGVCSMHQGHVPDGGHAAPTSWEHVEAVPGMWHMPGMVHVPVVHPGRVARALDTFSMFPGCGGSVPTMWHASLARGTHPRRVLDARLGCAPSRA